MVPPIGVGIAAVLGRKKWNSEEIAEIKVAFPMGLCMITEGVIPIAARDPIRVIACTTVGCAIAGALSLTWGVGSSIPSGGVFIIPFVNKPLYFVIALLVGSFVTGILLTIVKPVAKELPEEVKEDVLDLNSIKINKQ